MSTARQRFTFRALADFHPSLTVVPEISSCGTLYSVRQFGILICRFSTLIGARNYIRRMARPLVAS